MGVDNICGSVNVCDCICYSMDGVVGMAVIKTVWVDSEVGRQLKFAVPVESENEPVVDKVEEIRKEIISELDNTIYRLQTLAENLLQFGKDSSGVPSLVSNIGGCEIAKEIVIKIFEKYRK